MIFQYNKDIYFGSSQNAEDKTEAVLSSSGSIKAKVEETGGDLY